MKKRTERWFKYAQDDLGIAKNLLEHTAYYNGCIYHCHQCVEKILKALTIELHIKLAKSHNLDVVYKNLPTEIQMKLNIPLQELLSFNEIFISTKYPVENGLLPHGTPNKSDAEYFLNIAEKILTMIHDLIL